MAVYTAIDDAGSFFNTVLYTGTGGVQTISEVGFEPGLTWCKDRTNSYDQVWFDQARGATERITSNTTAAESTQVNDLTAWNSDGFVVGSGSNINNNTNLLWVGTGKQERHQDYQVEQLHLLLILLIQHLDFQF